MAPSRDRESSLQRDQTRLQESETEKYCGLQDWTVGDPRLQTETGRPRRHQATNRRRSIALGWERRSSATSGCGGESFKLRRMELGVLGWDEGSSSAQTIWKELGSSKLRQRKLSGSRMHWYEWNLAASDWDGQSSSASGIEEGRELGGSRLGRRELVGSRLG